MNSDIFNSNAVTGAISLFCRIMQGNSNSNELPDLRSIFFNSELTEQTTALFNENNTAITEFLNKHFSDFKTYNKIDCLITSTMVEAQATGFEQGFEFAVRLLLGSYSHVGAERRKRKAATK